MVSHPSQQAILLEQDIHVIKKVLAETVKRLEGLDFEIYHEYLDYTNKSDDPLDILFSFKFKAEGSKVYQLLVPGNEVFNKASDPELISNVLVKQIFDKLYEERIKNSVEPYVAKVVKNFIELSRRVAR
jgi:hypothetical protein